MIRPKLTMCDDGNYRETRWFTAWTRKQEIEDYRFSVNLYLWQFCNLSCYSLPRMITDVTGQTNVPFGDGVIALRDTVLGKIFNKIKILFFF